VKNYSKLSTYAFQGLEPEDDSGTTPFVPAWWEYSYVGEPNKLGARFSANADALSLVRTDGQDTNRVSASGGWHLPYTSSSGQVVALDESLLGLLDDLPDCSGVALGVDRLLQLMSGAASLAEIRA